MTIKRLYHKTEGYLLGGFFIVDKNDKMLAISAEAMPDFVMRAKRYEHDLDLVRKCEQLTGKPVRK